MKRIDIKTDRLQLCPLDIQHREHFFELVSTNEAYLNESFPITVLNTKTLVKTGAYLKSMQEKWLLDQGGQLGVWLEETLVGMIMLKNLDWSVPRCELGYFVGEKFASKGYTTEALNAVVQYCFEELKLVKVYLRVIATNKASLTLAEKCGFEKEGYFKKEYRTGNKDLVDLVYFARFAD